MSKTEISEAQGTRREVLMQLYGARPVSMSAANMSRNLQRWGERIDADILAREAAFLAGQGMAIESTDPVSGEKRWTISSAGVIAYEQM